MKRVPLTPSLTLLPTLFINYDNDYDNDLGSNATMRSLLTVVVGFI